VEATAAVVVRRSLSVGMYIVIIIIIIIAPTHR
jgi:hypothetical protein